MVSENFGWMTIIGSGLLESHGNLRVSAVLLCQRWLLWSHRKAGRGIEVALGRLPYQCKLDIRGVADIRPDAHFQAIDPSGQLLGPPVGWVDVGKKQQRGKNPANKLRACEHLGRCARGGCSKLCLAASPRCAAEDLGCLVIVILRLGRGPVRGAAVPVLGRKESLVALDGPGTVDEK